MLSPACSASMYMYIYCPQVPARIRIDIDQSASGYMYRLHSTSTASSFVPPRCPGRPVQVGHLLAAHVTDALGCMPDKIQQQRSDPVDNGAAIWPAMSWHRVVVCIRDMGVSAGQLIGRIMGVVPAWFSPSDLIIRQPLLPKPVSLVCSF
jgi:hypothetical protein